MEKNSETRNLILEKATKLFAAKGYDGVGVQEICTESKITKPTLYYYFGSKTGLLSAIVEEKGAEFYNTLQYASKYIQDFVLSLTKILESTINFALENPEFYRLHCGLVSSSLDSEAGRLYRPFIEKEEKLFLDFFLCSSAEFGNMKGKENLYSRIFFQTCQSVALDIIQNLLEKTDSMIFSIVHSFVYGVAAG